MVSVALVSHKGFASGLLQSAEMILGKEVVKDVQTIELDGLMGIEKFSDQLKAWLDTCNDPDGVLVLADLFGGSPCIAALTAAVERADKPPVEVVGGVNLGMLIEVLMNRPTGMPLTDLVEAAKNAGLESVVAARDRQAAESDTD
ncbi:MAG TPA: PTS sugar transporter subunit IIA [Symbiobacteriaceae bacterium]